MMVDLVLWGKLTILSSRRPCRCRREETSLWRKRTSERCPFSHQSAQHDWWGWEPQSRTAWRQTYKKKKASMFVECVHVVHDFQMQCNNNMYHNVMLVICLWSFFLFIMYALILLRRHVVDRSQRMPTSFCFKESPNIACQQPCRHPPLLSLFLFLLKNQKKTKKKQRDTVEEVDERA